MTYYLKWTRKGRVPSYQGGDPLPYRRWTTNVPNPELCERGWHACRWNDAIHHIADELWIAELAAPIVEGADKVAAGRLRIVRKVQGINERTLRLFAADAAEQVSPIFEKAHPGDDRPRQAIAAARLYAEGKITAAAQAAAQAAARDAARDAARTTARDAAWAAAWAAAVAASDAARAAARAGDAAGDAERVWQTDRLLVHYGGLTRKDFA